jgi:hypothetical protein
MDIACPHQTKLHGSRQMRDTFCGARNQDGSRCGAFPVRGSDHGEVMGPEQGRAATQ